MTWYRDGMKLCADRRVSMVTEKSKMVDGQVYFNLIIKDVRVEESGIYRLKARNSAGEMFTDVPVLVKTHSGIEEDDAFEVCRYIF